MPARHVSRTARGYLAAISDDLGHRIPVGVFDSVAAALVAARTAFNAALDAQPGLEAA
jgi:hypothetical protein